MYPVTVIIPHYNEPRERLDATVASCLAAQAADVVVVDDGSDTPPTEVAGARLVRIAHRGISAALNKGLAMAEQPWIAVLGCGDTMPAERFEWQLGSGAPAVFSDLQDPRDCSVSTADANWRERIWRDNQFSWATCACRTHILRAIGGWNESLRYGVDWEASMIVECAVGWTHVPGIAAIGYEMEGGHTATGGDTRHRDIATIARWANEMHRRVTC